MEKEASERLEKDYRSEKYRKRFIKKLCMKASFVHTVVFLLFLQPMARLQRLVIGRKP
jgi:hypothetical protein